jgi:hypothetical protein
MDHPGRVAYLHGCRSAHASAVANHQTHPPKDRIASEEFKMPIQLSEENGGKILVMHPTGKLARADYGPLESEFERLVGQHGKLRVLFDMTGFHGWDADAIWTDIKFDTKHFADIERLATICDRKWQHGLAIFFKPFTKAVCRHFDHADAAEARKWLAEGEHD